MFTWEKLLCAKREREHSSRNPEDIRTEFRKDYHRIIGSASFRRLQDKAQVYPLKRGDRVRTRLTHSLEVSSFAGSLGDTIFRRLIDEGKPGVDEIVRENCSDILECAGLVHDIGNPPFGHFGEFAIRQWFDDNLSKLSFRGQPVSELLTDRMKADFLNFEGNAQALRVLTRLHCLMDMDTGMNLTYALLNTIVKYPVSSLGIDKNSGDIRTKKMGYYLSEEPLFRDITECTGAGELRYPLTFILESADDIAYKTADIEDAAVKGMVSYHRILDELRGGRYRENRSSEETAMLDDAADRLERSFKEAGEFNMRDPQLKAVQRWIVGLQSTLIYAAADAFCGNYEAIMNGEFRRELLAASPAAALADALGDIAYRYAFRSSSIVMSELSEDAMMTFLLDKIVGAALRFDTDEKRIFDRDLTEVLSENYLEICRRACDGKTDAEQCYRRLLFATDCVCGMTDSYAEEFYRMLSGNEG
ncbi:MAG: dNTP triphosphohydrolase [Oscillospiraceae bacterium]|nr:dNTP triphosphohydrolase [Oscillospiraceae bacterium]